MKIEEDYLSVDKWNLSDVYRTQHFPAHFALSIKKRNFSEVFGLPYIAGCCPYLYRIRSERRPWKILHRIVKGCVGNGICKSFLSKDEKHKSTKRIKNCKKLKCISDAKFES